MKRGGLGRVWLYRKGSVVNPWERRRRKRRGGGGGERGRESRDDQRENMWGETETQKELITIKKRVMVMGKEEAKSGNAKFQQNIATAFFLLLNWKWNFRLQNGFFFFFCACDENGLRYLNEDAIIGCPCLFFSLLKNRASLMEKDCSFPSLSVTPCYQYWIMYGMIILQKNWYNIESIFHAYLNLLSQ